ncbi:CesT family type III secretion system chaperone [Endozoicomonas sp. OPT23]|uniref:CesT family type III secretion system chaperone n=1 Tax=Endozoicomonas sp. OPT23 TaxID=2072845 RepID=UPI0018911209|nr:CesT family type III secretion system chaperone [Endozoicomonas sp. OPT23]
MTGLELLNSWMQDNGITEEALDETGRTCSFVYNSNLPVTVEAPAYCDDLFIIIELCEIGRGEIRRKRLETAMKLNAYGLETRGGILGWDSIAERIILSYRLTAESSTPDLLSNIVSNLLDVSELVLPDLAMEKEKAEQEELVSNYDHIFKQVQP